MTAVAPIETAKPAAGASAGTRRRAAGQSRHPRHRRYQGRAGLSEGIPVRSQGDRKPGLAVEAGAQRRHPAHPPPPQGARLPARSGTPRKTNPRSRPLRARSPKSSPPRSRSHDHVVVDWAMRYGNPSIRSRIDALTAQGCDRLLVVPLYPQYSAATSATVCDEVFRVLAEMRAQPTLAGDAALLRRSRLYRGAGGLDHRASGEPCRSSRS